jgi:hypothetical protein
MDLGIFPHPLILSIFVRPWFAEHVACMSILRRGPGSMRRRGGNRGIKRKASPLSDCITNGLLDGPHPFPLQHTNFINNDQALKSYFVSCLVCYEYKNIFWHDERDSISDEAQIISTITYSSTDSLDLIRIRHSFNPNCCQWENLVSRVLNKVQWYLVLNWWF